MKKGQAFNPFGRRDNPADPRTLDEIQRRTPAAGGSMELTHLPAAISLTPKTGPPAREYTLPFHPLGIVSNGGNLEAYLQPAVVVNRHIRLPPVGNLNIEEPMVNGTNSMWEDPIPALNLAGNVSYNYLHINTDYNGATNSNWNVTSLATEMQSVHHVPPDPDGTGFVNGQYYIELFRTNIGNANPLELKWGGNYIWDDTLWQGKHEGGGAEPYREYDELNDVHYFRSHLEGHGHNIVEQATTINHKFCGRNIGSSSGNVGYVYTGNTAKDCAEFNIIIDSYPNPQVRVSQATNESPILVRGNNKDLTINIRNCDAAIQDTIEFVDGLCVTSGTIDLYIPECGSQP